MADLGHYVEKLKQNMQPADAQVLAALAPSGKLRAGINLSNFLLVTGHSKANMPEGVSPDIAAVLAELIECDIEYVTFKSPGAVADAAQKDEWDIGNIGADPARASHINFTAPYCEIEATYLLPANSTITSFEDVDRPGIRIATKKRAAYTLWLERNLKHAELVQYDSTDGSFDGFVENKLELLAGLKPRLTDDASKLSGSRILAGKFTAVEQAIGTPSNRDRAGIDYLEKFIATAKEIGLVQKLIDQHGVCNKLSVAKF